MAVDQTVGVTNQGAGIKIDVSEVTRSDGVAVERQRIVIGDASSGDATSGKLAAVRGEAGGQNSGLVISSEVLEILQSIDTTLKEVLMMMQITLQDD